MRTLRTGILALIAGTILNGPASEVRAAERQFRIVFGANETVERNWDGQVSVEAGRLVRLSSWKFQSPDAVQPPNAWTCQTRWIAARRVARWEPTINAARPGYLQRPGVLVTVDTGDMTAVNVTTPHGAFAFRPSGFRLGHAESHLSGRVSVDEVPVDTRLSGKDTFDDAPAIAVGPNGEVWVAWIRYGRDADEVVARRFNGRAWGDVEVVSPYPADHYRVDLAFDPQGHLWLVTAVQVEGNWDLYARSRAANEWAAPIRITTTRGPDIHHRLAVGPSGVFLAWQSFAGDTSDIYLAALQGDKFGSPVRVSSSPANDWEPAVTVAPDGSIWVAWDSYERGNYDIFARRFALDGGRLVPRGGVLDVARSPRFESQPSIGADRDGRIWIAYHEGGLEWGKDTGYFMQRSGSGLYMERFVRVACLTPDGQRRFPAEAIQSEFPYELREFCDHPQVEIDGDGRVWVFFRHRTLRLWSGYGNSAHRAIWEIYGSYFSGHRWSPPISIPNSFGRSDMRSRTALGPDRRLWLTWADDSRVPPGYLPQAVNVHVASLPLPTEPADPPQLQPASDGPAFRNVVHPNEAIDVARVRSYRPTIGGTTYRIVRGDFHRHTDISHDGTKDGSLLDAYRYAIDAAAQDFLGVTDHDYGSNDYDWWRTQKSVDLFHVPGAFVPMYSYERSLGYPNGHRNIVHAVRGVRALDRGEGEAQRKTNTGRFLYPHLRETGGIAMSHTSATNMGTDWRDNDPELEPVVEIFQGDRNSYEHAGAPLAATADEPELHKGGYRPAGFVWNAWAKGYKLGVQASSDHVSTHCSYCCIYVPDSDFTRDGMLEALKRRHCYGATDNILVDFRLITPDGEHLMGDIVETDARPQFRITIDGTAALKSVDVIKNNRYVYQNTPRGDAVTFVYDDREPTDGESYYYVRAEQVDGHVAWASPIWMRR